MRLGPWQEIGNFFVGKEEHQDDPLPSLPDISKLVEKASNAIEDRVSGSLQTIIPKQVPHWLKYGYFVVKPIVDGFDYMDKLVLDSYPKVKPRLRKWQKEVNPALKQIKAKIREWYIPLKYIQ
ncbi:MAG: hypothetical protein V1837_02060 [Candidatus Woesearchaeota archaeon]